MAASGNVQRKVGERTRSQNERPSPLTHQKTASILRTRLAQELGVERLYDVDHLDLTVASTIDQATQHAVTEMRHNLRTREHARSAGLVSLKMRANFSF